MTLTINVTYDEDLIVSLTAEHDGYCYAWEFGGKQYEMDAYDGFYCDGIELELSGLPDKDGQSRWTAVDPDGYTFSMSEPVDLDLGFLTEDEAARMVLR